MSNFYSDNPDLAWYVERGVDWAPLVELTEFLHRSPDGFKDARSAVEAYRDVLNLVGELAGDVVAPRAARIDREGVRLVDGEGQVSAPFAEIFEQLGALELHGLALPRELGGQNCPLTVFFLASELMARADLSVMTHFSFHGPMAMAMLAYSWAEGSTTFDPATATITRTRFADAIEEIRRGAAWGAMDITEPDAGSDMAALRTTGTLGEDGQWRLDGQKIFITSGHGKYHFVIARTERAGDPEDPFAGLGGLSMFLARAYEDGEGGRRRFVTIDRLEEKLGHHGSPTASLVFEGTPAELVGQRGEGFKLMLTLMNGARVGVGFEGVGVCEAALRLARAYAAERRSMGKTIDRHEMIADYLDEMETDLLGLRALGVQCAVEVELAQKGGIVLATGLVTDPEEKRRREADVKRHSAHARRLTPLFKYLASEKAVQMARTAIQIHGGVGYTKEYGAEKLLRDALVLPIYEGTSQIQSLMVMKDTLTGIMKEPKRFATRVAQARWHAATARDPLERRVARIQGLARSAEQHLLTRTVADKGRQVVGEPVAEWAKHLKGRWDPKRDFAYAMLHAERLTQLLADEAVAELLLGQARRDPERRVILERYLERAEPRARHLYERITTTGQRLLESLAGDREAERRVG
jgi:alkylation response protein AidB-like acyl-CoA dehydrogenase